METTVHKEEDGLEDYTESLDSNVGSAFQTLPNKLGNEVQHAWKKHSKALHSDIAISG
jgi:hypothetical protein